MSQPFKFLNSFPSLCSLWGHNGSLRHSLRTPQNLSASEQQGFANGHHPAAVQVLVARISHIFSDLVYVASGRESAISLEQRNLQATRAAGIRDMISQLENPTM